MSHGPINFDKSQILTIYPLEYPKIFLFPILILNYFFFLISFGPKGEGEREIRTFLWGLVPSQFCYPLGLILIVNFLSGQKENFTRWERNEWTVEGKRVRWWPFGSSAQSANFVPHWASTTLLEATTCKPFDLFSLQFEGEFEEKMRG